MSLPLQLSYIALEGAKDVKSVELNIDGRAYPIPRSQQRSDAFRKDLDEPLTFAAGQLSISVHRKKSRLRFWQQPPFETFTIGSGDVQSRLEGHVFQQKRGELLITLGFASQTQIASRLPNPNPSSPADTESLQPNTEQLVVVRSVPTDIAVGSTGTSEPSNSEGLQPTTQELIDICPRFRVLVVGKSGVGKSTLINRIFGLEVAHVAKDRPGQAAIDKELISQENNRFILHDSRGFEPAEGSNYDVVKSFIEERKRMPDVKDQLHAVWLCFQVPILKYGERLLEDGVEAFLREANEALGNIPTIVVFTKYDRLVSFVRKKKSADPEAEAKRYLQTYCIEPIQDFTGGTNISHVATSSKHRCERGLEELINLTQEKVSKNFASPGNAVSPVHLAAVGAQRMLPTLKVELSIEVGKQRYWRALASSANFQGYTMLNCLRVIHTDIVLVWNFYDLDDYLNSSEFLNLMMSMVETVDAATRPTAEPAPLGRSDTFASNPIPLLTLAPVVLPFAACVILVTWAYETYQRLQRAHQKFMAYIVDLTHVLEILFLHTAEAKGKKLTRRAIKLAFKAYYESSWRRNVHTDIRLFEGRIGAQDPILEKITFLISSADAEANVRAAIEGLPPFDSEVDEEWDDGQQGR
ncbi:P-loop containing nucleoside triphosphate hydrolase protein [Pisolithus tinctorius]|nr:P-loop containing nucleoside triphosphate hydrolase protein [Pisolithus tinctorius]